MASRLRKRKRNDPPDKWRSVEEAGETMDYRKAEQCNVWKIERKLADDIMESLRRNGVQDVFKLDHLTRGKGNCFMIAMMQQLRREEVCERARPEIKEVAANMNHRVFRVRVHDWVMKHLNHPKIVRMRDLYELDQAIKRDLGEETKSWNDYWNYMLKDGIWADNWFVQASALFLSMDIWIMDTTCTKKKPYFQVDGNLEDGEYGTDTLYLGLAHESHYQSLLINDNEDMDVDGEDGQQDKGEWKQKVEEKESKEEDENKDEEENEDEDDEIIENNCCPICKKVLKNVLMHIKKAKNCKAAISDEKLTQLSNKNEMIRKEKQKRTQNERKASSRKRLRDDDYEKVNEKEKEWDAKRMRIMRNEDEEKVKKDQRDRKEKSRKKISTNAKNRLERFREDVMYGPLFICICCHGKMFRHSVQEANEQLMNKIEQKIPITSVITDMNVLTRIVTEYSHNPWSLANKKKKDEIGTRYICTYCVSYLKSGKMPSTCVMNSLQLQDTDSQLKKQDLWLTELEASLISNNLIFHKIFSLPKSRWTGLTGKVINVPLTSEAINNTLVQLPRTPTSAGLISLTFKRMKDMKNSHKKQLINPDKIFRMLQKLKELGSPYHQNLLTPEEFKNECGKNDQNGYQLLYGKDDLEDDMKAIDFEEGGDKVLEDEFKNELNEEMDKTIDNEEIIGIINRKNYKPRELETDKQNTAEEMLDEDPVKKYHFEYDKSLCMMDKYPEITLAPGEGHKPKGMLGDRHWDVKAFPHLHNANGSNGKDEDRNVKLTDQRYFIQRILNKEKRFAESPAYLYSAVAFLEEKRIFQNLSLVGSRGKELRNGNNEVSYKLEDEFRALESIPNSPKYWQHKKYEILAKIDNLGPFHIFFTLSCADQRWEETFATILHEKGHDLVFKFSVVNGVKEVVTEVKTSDGKWKELMKFLEEDLGESKHELIRGNVVMATRNLHRRVQAFLKRIVLDKNNPMNVKHYTLKVEFQERGAAHYHGTLWVDLPKLEMVREVNGELQNSKEKGPMHGIVKAFKKLKNTEKLDKNDTNCLVKFIDSFITVSTCEALVGKDVARAVKEVNQHRHSKTCRKYGGTCRFDYPKPPAPFTMIVQPLVDSDSKRRQKKLTDSSRIIANVMTVLDDEDNLKKIMVDYDKDSEDAAEYKINREERIKRLCRKAEVEYKEYVDALQVSHRGYSVVYARDIDELYINTYNEDWMRAWDGNLDIQLCLDYYKVSTYITDYYAKSDTALMEALQSAIKASDATDIKEKMKLVANLFLTHRQIGEAEAVYRLIPSLTLSMSSIACQFVFTSKKEERSLRWRRATEEQLQSGIRTKKLENHDGYWYEQPDMWNKYLRRPQSVREISFAQFAKMYKGFNPKKDEKEDGGDDDLELDAEIEEIQELATNIEDSESKFNYIMTSETNGKERKKLPDLLRLSNPHPGEAPFMKKRQNPAALRFHKFKKDNDYKRFMRSELMLYYPLEDEVQDEQIEELYNEMVDGRRKVHIVKRQVMEHLESVEEARYYVDQMKKEVRESIVEENVAAQMDGMGKQDDDECVEEEDEEIDDYQYCDPANIDKEDPQKNTSVFKRLIVPPSDELRKMTITLDKYQREVLNIIVKYARGIVKSRKQWNGPPKPPLLMVHGGAGAGKSTVIHVITNWTHKILRQEGDSLDQPYVVKTAFTGCAAANIEGQTLHGTFGFSFDNQHFSLNDKIRDQKRVLMRNLQLVIIDEISMVKADMLYMLDLRLQELKEKIGTPFGGVAVVVFGDLMQLAPCMGRYVFQEPANPEFKITHSLASRWKMFSSLLLEINHRQGNDKIYAELLNRLRIGEETEEDLELLSSRIRKENEADIRSADVYIGCKRKDVAQRNLLYIIRLKGKATKIRARHHHPTQANFNPRISQKDGAVGTTTLLEELILKVGAKLMIVQNIDTADMLCNGQIGTLVELIRTANDVVDLLVIKLMDNKAGENNRKKYPKLSIQYPDCVFIEKVSVQYTLRKKSGNVGSTATVIQFPVRLAHAITAHKIQGQSIIFPTTVAMDLNSVFEAGQAYVMLSRIQCIEQLLIVDKLDTKKLKSSPAALEELRRLESISFNRNPSPWHKEDDSSIKVASLNCAGLLPHLRDIRSDEKLLNAGVIHLLETSLSQGTDTEDISITGFQGQFVNVGNGKGIATYNQDGTQCQLEKEEMNQTLQIMKFNIGEISSITVYKSSNHSTVETANTLKKFIDVRETTLITGDFNVCTVKDKRNAVTKMLEELGFKQLVKVATHIQGGHIDHCYWLDETMMWELPQLEHYTPYYSDHDCLLVTLKKK